MKIVRLGEMKNNLEYIFVNYIINKIPCWTIRKILYKCMGMKIGKNSRIMMKVIVLSPELIQIGNRTIINEFSFIDGRGGLCIGNDCAISVYSKIITGSHDYKSCDFKYITNPATIGNNVWICANATVVSPAVIENRCIIGAGSVFSGHAIENGIYNGNPALFKRMRCLELDYQQDWKPYFR